MNTSTLIGNVALIGTPALIGGATLAMQCVANHNVEHSAFSAFGDTLTATALGAVVGGFIKFLTLPNFQKAHHEITDSHLILKRRQTSASRFVLVVANKQNGEVSVLKLSDSADSNDHLLDEYRVLSQIRSPYVVTAKECITRSGHVILRLEYVRGDTLSAAFDAEGKFDWHKGVHVITEIAKGLRDIHRAGYSHGDLAYENRNIILTLDEKIVFLDFGDAYRTDDPQSEMDVWARNAQSNIFRENWSNTSLQAILERASKKGPEGYPDYDALVKELEALA